MKRVVLSSILLAIFILASSQIPESFNYQVVVRDGTTNSPLMNQNVSFKMSVLKGSISGESQYSELHSANTGALGIVNLVIGDGTGKTGDITTIDWGADTYYLKVEIDKTGGSAYTLMGITHLLTVPYAMYSKKAGTATETDPIFGVWNKSTGISITASQVTDFQTSVTNNASVLANTAKNSYPTEDATKLTGIAAGAEVNVNADWDAIDGDAQILNKPILSNVAISGNYIDLNNKPTLFNGNYNDLINKPTNVSSLINDVGYLTSISIPNQTAGDLMYNNGTNWVRLPKGNPGQVLAMNNSSQPKWVDLFGMPALTTASISEITGSTATSGGNITNDGGQLIIARGVCWNTSPSPTIEASKTSDGTGIGIFSSSIFGLDQATTYYVRAYATNSIGTSYGSPVSFTTYTSPTVTTTTLSGITQNSVISGGNVTSDGGTPVITRGICWSTNQNPTILDNKTTNGSGTGTFTSNITGLSSNITYYIRAYASNSIYTSYGNELTVTLWINQPGPQVTDIDGNTYNSVKLLNQVWMAQNLKVTKYRNGDLIGTTSTATLDISGETTPKYQWAYDGNESNVPIYGRLYTWYALMDSRGVCPTGWHLPTIDDLTILTDYLGGWSAAGGKMKEIGTTYWLSPNIGATNESGFNGLPGGFRSGTGDFVFLGYYGIWWSASLENLEMFRLYELTYQTTNILQSSNSGDTGMSVRCIKD